MKKRLAAFILFISLFLNGCSSSSGIPLFGYSWWGETPDTVTVQRGDTLYSISRRYNVPLRDIIEANKMIPPYRVYVGQILKMPSAKYHIVKKGDTLYNISKRYNVDMSSLSRINNLDVPYALSIGQRLVLPGSVVEAPVKKASSSTKTTKKVTTKKTSSSSWWSRSSKKEKQNSYGPLKEKLFLISAPSEKVETMTVLI